MERGERVLMSLVDAAGTPVVATTQAIYLGGSAERRRGWAGLAGGRWDPGRGILRLVGMTDDVQVTLNGAARPRLVALVREQFGASVLISAPVPLAGGRTAAVTARRVPGSGE